MTRPHQADFGDVLNLDTSSALSEILAGYDVRNITPRETQQLARELYFDAGVLDGDEYSLLAFQPEVDDPHTYREITGTEPQPDTPVDLVEKYKTLLEKQKDSEADQDTIELTQRLVQMLANLAALSAA